MIPITKEIKRINKSGGKKNISFKLQFTENVGFMASSSSNTVDSSLKGFIKLNVNMDMIIKNAKLSELNTKIENFVLNT